MQHSFRLVPLLVAAFSVSLTGCWDVVTTHYDTLAEFKDKDHGWLPADLLPASTHDITTRNDLDFNTSSGEFSFDPGEAANFLAQLKPGAPTQSPYENWDRIVRRHDQSGRKAWTYNSEGTLWVFFCNRDEGYCEYDMWDIVRHTTTPPPMRRPDPRPPV